MSKILLKQLTENSWVLNNEKTNKTVAVVVRKHDVFTIVGGTEKFDSIEEIARKKFSMEISETKQESKKSIDVAGLPVSSSEAFDIKIEILNDVELSTYTKSEDSDLRFVAGYFGIKTEKSPYTANLSPKLSTLQNNIWIGPFKTKFELNFELTKLNRGA